MKYIIVNTGSTSKKYALYEGDKQLSFIHLEKNDKGFNSTIRLDGMYEEKYTIDTKNYDDAINYILSIFIKKSLIKSKSDILKIAIRIVAPGTFFTENRFVDANYIKKLGNAAAIAPLHIEPILHELKNIKKNFPSVPLYGISDSTFHKDMPQITKLYALPMKISKKYDIERFGYHGISLQSIVNTLRRKNELPKKMIICHMGGGVTVCAIKNGISIDTTMGFTPLEGMTMATRIGDIDPGALLYVSEVTGLKGLKLKEFLNHECGLLGLSDGESSSVKDLFNSKSELAKLALDMYAYKIQKQIGAYIAALGGLDLLVFTGTVGERSFLMREKICNKLSVFGLNLYTEINNRTEDKNAIISHADSKVIIEVIKTDEIGEMARTIEGILS